MLQIFLGKTATPELIAQVKSMPPQQQIRYIDANLSKEDRREIYKLGAIKYGEKKGEWDAATSADLAKDQEKLRLKKSKIAAGTYDPEDTSLWTDNKWILCGKSEDPMDAEEYDSLTPEQVDAAIKASGGRHAAKKDIAKGGGRKVFAPTDSTR